MKPIFERHRFIQRWILGIALTTAFASAAAGQVSRRPSTPESRDLEQLRVEVVLSRFQQERLVSRQPYAFVVAGSETTRLRMGARTPIRVTRSGSSDNPTSSYQYQDVGTDIDCRVEHLENGRYLLSLSLESSSVFAPEGQPSAELPLPGNPPVLQSFSTAINQVLALSQKLESMVSTDPLTGEVLKVEVSLSEVE